MLNNLQMIFRVFVRLFIDIIEDVKMMNVIEVCVTTAALSFFAQIRECLKIADVALNVSIL